MWNLRCLGSRFEISSYSRYCHLQNTTCSVIDLLQWSSKMYNKLPMMFTVPFGLNIPSPLFVISLKWPVILHSSLLRATEQVLTGLNWLKHRKDKIFFVNEPLAPSIHLNSVPEISLRTFQDARGGAAQSFTWKIDLTHAECLSMTSKAPACSCGRALARARRDALTEARYVLSVWKQMCLVADGKDNEQKPEAIWKMHLCVLGDARVVHRHFRCHGQEISHCIKSYNNVHCKYISLSEMDCEMICAFILYLYQPVLTPTVLSRLLNELCMWITRDHHRNESGFDFDSLTVPLTICLVLLKYKY